MALLPFVRRTDAHMLVVGMTGAKMGDRLVQIGCEDGGRLGAIAAKVGLSGHAVAIVPDEASASRARKGAAGAGVLVDVDVAPPTRLAATDDSFDVAVVDDTGGLLRTMRAEDRMAAVGELRRILRPGGRVVFISGVPRGGLSAIFARAPNKSDVSSDTIHESLAGAGLRSVRTLAERDGLVFIEGVKPRVQLP